MAEFTGERSVVIQAPITVVYEYVSDFPRHVEWNHQPTEMTKITDGPVGVGSVFRTVESPPSNASRLIKVLGPMLSKLMGAKGYTEAEITALELDRHVAWRAKAPMKNGSLFAKADWEINLEQQGEGTRVTQEVRFQTFGKMAERMDSEKMAQGFYDEMAHNLTQLKTIVETQTAPATEPGRAAFA